MHRSHGFFTGLSCAFVVAGTVSFLLGVGVYTDASANLPPVITNYWSPRNGNTGISVLTHFAWEREDPEGQPVLCDLYLGTDPDPPLYASNLWMSFDLLNPLAFSTTYYWKIVARDSDGLETTGPIWSFTTSENVHAPYSHDPSPPNNGYGSLNQKLWWISYDLDGQFPTDDVYFGTAEPLPLVASGIAGGWAKEYSPGALQAGTKYYWRVVTSDGDNTTTGQTWSFTAIPTLQGDVDFNGVVTVDDAACALQTFMHYGPYTDYADCGGNGAVSRADVNCDQKLTPRDARCIHKNALDGSCSFCTGTLATAAAAQRFTPVVTKDSAWIEWDTLIVRLAVSGVPSLQSFGFHSLHHPYMYLVRAARYGVSSSSSVLATQSYYNDPPYNGAEVAGYWLDQADATSSVGFIELRYYLPDRQMTSVEIGDFAEDLEGAPSVVINQNEVPVLFSSFSATPIAGGIDVRWQLTSGEAMESYSLYRRDGISSPARLITQGPVQSARGSYLDRSVQAGSNYRYELMVKTTDGDIFRSPEAIAALPAVQLALYQNTPNPFNPQTTIRYELPGNGLTRVRLWILDVGGRMVRTLVDEEQPPGTHEVRWNGTNSAGKGVSSGVYFSVLDVDRERRTRKILLLK